MNLCLILSICDTTLRLLFSGLIGFAFILNTVPTEAKSSAGTISVSENSSAAEKRNSILIADTEEEVEIEEAFNKQSNKQGVGADFLFPALIICSKTESLFSVSYLKACKGSCRFQKTPFYILYKQLKVQSI